MRPVIGSLLALCLLVGPAHSQPRNENGHYDDWYAKLEWGASMQTLDVIGGFGARPLRLTLSEKGFDRVYMEKTLA